MSLWLGRSGNHSSRYQALKNCSGRHFADWILFFQSLWLSFGFHCWFVAKAIMSENHWEVYTLTHSVGNIHERALRNNMHMSWENSLSKPFKMSISCVKTYDRSEKGSQASGADDLHSFSFLHRWFAGIVHLTESYHRWSNMTDNSPFLPAVALLLVKAEVVATFEFWLDENNSYFLLSRGAFQNENACTRIVGLILLQIQCNATTCTGLWFCVGFCIFTGLVCECNAKLISSNFHLRNAHT